MFSQSAAVALNIALVLDQSRAQPFDFALLGLGHGLNCSQKLLDRLIALLGFKNLGFQGLLLFGQLAFKPQNCLLLHRGVVFRIGQLDFQQVLILDLEPQFLNVAESLI